MEISIENSICEFKKYVKNFDFENNNISMKYYHTFRVVDYAKTLAKNKNLNQHDSYIAFITALLHDIARFKQITEYNTFADLKSFDHGDMGYTILTENDYISNYVSDIADKFIVLKAIKNHNKYSIEPSLNDRELFFARLVRDADKLDILDTQKFEIKDNDFTIDPITIDFIKQRKLFMRDGITRNDASRIIISISLVFDINFKKSFEIILEKQMLKRKFDCLKKHFDVNLISELENIVYSYINNKLSNSTI
ncbi:MAG: HD domain-containing protein [Clostridia bacterium]|nr:HD domain-containing protein [Clostridia bacterium]